ncbi:hypothetical protein D9V41_12525 [Aeromicrobium phragmitis]|uniref:Uncharacterized protein n=1 Tax=Aeromicrobium phragmitis TaxID=2478914 RepID=A0A3L8PM95_9ACTN|nr:hypothetical protein [Aeromicrobium phragmitis]RLV55142.1 hypothetical protein D9V41_12525 [Aeromicrobium phragmitis]
MLPALALAFSIPGCGADYPAELLGSIALQANEDGSFTAVVVVCRGQVDEIEVSKIDPTDPDDRTRSTDGGTWQRRDERLSRGVHELPLGDPGPEWVVRTPPNLDDPTKLYVFRGSGQLEDKGTRVTRQTALTGEAIARLQPGHVLFNDDQLLTREEFDNYCSSPPRPLLPQ